MIVNNLKSIVLILFAAWFVFLNNSAAFALPPEQRELYDLGISHFDYGNSTCGGNSAANSSIYVIGDSLTVGMKSAGLQNKLSERGWNVLDIEASESINTQDSISRITRDSNLVSQAQTVVVMLGTNDSGDIGAQVEAMATEIRKYSPDTKILWMNAHTSVRDYDVLNASISDNASSFGIQVIDWKSEWLANPDKYPFTADGIHHNSAAYGAKNDYLVANVGTPISTVGGGGSSTATQSLEEFIDTYGRLAFDAGKQYGIPYEAILAQAIIESAYGRSGLTVEANNFHGIKANRAWTGPVWIGGTREETSSGSSYEISDAAFRAYDSPQAGFIGYAEFIHANSRYRNALNYPGDPYKYIEEIKAAGYATDNEYVTTNHAMVARVEQYISSKNLFPPSSLVNHDVSPPNPAVTSTGSGSQLDGCIPAEGQGVAVSGDLEGNKAIGAQQAAERGWVDQEWVCLERLWTKESGWKETADNPSSTAYGIPQALLGDHRGNIDSNYPGYYTGDYKKPSGGDPAVQIKWGLDYIEGRYQTPCRAWSHSEAKGWY